MNLEYYFIRKKRLASFLFIQGYTRFIQGLYNLPVIVSSNASRHRVK
jgi:hypothetical protein